MMPIRSNHKNMPSFSLVIAAHDHVHPPPITCQGPFPIAKTMKRPRANRSSTSSSTSSKSQFDPMARVDYRNGTARRPVFQTNAEVPEEVFEDDDSKTDMPPPPQKDTLAVLPNFSGVMNHTDEQKKAAMNSLLSSLAMHRSSPKKNHRSRN